MPPKKTRRRKAKVDPDWAPGPHVHLVYGDDWNHYPQEVVQHDSSLSDASLCVRFVLPSSKEACESLSQDPIAFSNTRPPRGIR